MCSGVLHDMLMVRERSDIGSSVLYAGRFDDTLEVRIQTAKRLDMRSAVLNEGWLLMLTNRVFRKQNV